MTSTPSIDTSTVRSTMQFCSVVSSESGEDPVGSSWHCGRYVLVELPLPWKYNSLESIHAPKGLGTLLMELWEVGHRWGFIGFAPDEEHSVAGMTRVLDYQLPAAPFARFSRTEYLFPTGRVVEFLRLMAMDPESDDLAAVRVDTDPARRDIFVCTHGAIDACCATFGYPIYKLLRHMARDPENGFRAWRCTHFGGHRFAATVLDMPEGRYWGHLSARDLGPLIRCDRPFTELRHRYRGWAALEHPVQQVAEAAAFEEAGWDWTERLVRVDEPTAAEGEQRVRIDYQHPGSGEEGSMVVDIIPNGTISTMHASNSPERHDAPQYRTRIVAG